MNKLRKMDNIYLFISVISVLCNCLGEAAVCTDFPNVILGTESKNITYGPSNEHNCNCDWTIPTSMNTDHETAVVLLLQNVSLPMTTDSIISTADCSGKIRFPGKEAIYSDEAIANQKKGQLSKKNIIFHAGTDEHKCEFKSNYCLVFATLSTICNISKIREKIPVANHTCDSITPWNKAGEGPYKILYFAGNFAGYTKYFTIQYLVIDCRPTTTLALATINEQTSTYQTATSLYGKQYSDPAIESTRTSNNIHCPTENTKIKNPQTALIIAIPVSGIVGLIAGALLMFIILRYRNNNNKSKNKDSMEMGSIQHQQLTVHERTPHENYTPTSDESGYEVPIQVDNKNEQQYEIITSGKEYQYENA
uniref:uncharacterized protein LOC120337975 n=1 Tax=Styela clava TaxID=7725 RepID=UPI001939BED0|nr:uncharacterized protein LOC120337975 [Styela clava]